MKKYLSIFLLAFILLTPLNIIIAQTTQGTLTADPSNNCPKLNVSTIDTTGQITTKSVSFAQLYGANFSNISTGANNADDKTVLMTIGKDGTEKRLLVEEYISNSLKITGYGNIYTEDGKNYQAGGISPTPQPPGNLPSILIPLTRKILLEKFSKIYSKISCPAQLKDLAVLFLRLLVVLNTVVGGVILYVLGKASIIRMTSRGNMDAIKKSTAMFAGCGFAICIIIGAYTGLIFLGTRLLPPSDCYRYSFIDSGRILFFFDQSDISPVLVNGDEAKAVPECINQ
jgi:hypothetical protein